MGTYAGKGSLFSAFQKLLIFIYHLEFAKKTMNMEQECMEETLLVMFNRTEWLN